MSLACLKQINEENYSYGMEEVQYHSKNIYFYQQILSTSSLF